MRCNLAVIMAKQRLSITELAQVTRLSRTTITALYHGNAKGVQFRTLDILCNTLNCKLTELLIPESASELKRRLAEEDFLKRQLTLDDVLEGGKS